MDWICWWKSTVPFPIDRLHFTRKAKDMLWRSIIRFSIARTGVSDDEFDNPFEIPDEYHGIDYRKKKKANILGELRMEYAELKRLCQAEIG
jgi:hypothetical protein